MRRRRLLHACGPGLVLGSLAGCLGNTAPSNDGSQSGSGQPCDDPRTIDYDAVDEHRDHGVYLENRSNATRTACVTVTGGDRTPEESVEEPSPLSQMGYEVHPRREVELYTFEAGGQYTVEVTMANLTRSEAFDISDSAFSDGEKTITTFEITGPESVHVAHESL